MIPKIEKLIADVIQDRKKYWLKKHFDISHFVVNYLINISDKYQFVYVETPKVACSSIKKTLQKIELNESKTQLPINPHNKKKSPLQAPYDLTIWRMKKALTSREYFRFSFVRNPYSRVLSAYLNKVGNPAERERLFFRNQLELTSNEELSFLDFLKIILQQTPDKMDIHWCPQSDLLGYAKIKYDFIGRFENFNEDFQFVIAKILEKEPHKIKDIIAVDQTHQTNANNYLGEYLTKEAQSLIQKIYQKDFENFGYSYEL